MERSEAAWYATQVMTTLKDAGLIDPAVMVAAPPVEIGAEVLRHFHDPGSPLEVAVNADAGWWLVGDPDRPGGAMLACRNERMTGRDRMTLDIVNSYLRALYPQEKEGQ